MYIELLVINWWYWWYNVGIFVYVSCLIDVRKKVNSILFVVFCEMINFFLVIERNWRYGLFRVFFKGFLV